MDIYQSKNLMYRPIGDVKYEGFLHQLLTSSDALNFDTSIPTGVTFAQADTISRTIGSRKLVAMYVGRYHYATDFEPVGFVALSRPEEGRAQHGCAFLSLAISRQCQRKGYGREAIAWALDWAFDFARLHRVEVSCYGWNPGARRLYERMGFREEGVKREAVWFMGGWHDVHEMAILEHEWRGQWRATAGAETWAPADGHSYSSEQIAGKMGSA